MHYRPAYHDSATPLHAAINLTRNCALLIVWIIANGGCSNQGLVDVHGSVTLDGKPLPGGIIAFEPVDGNGATAGGEIRAGKYELTGKAAVPPGEKIVRLTGVFKTGRQIEVGPPSPPGTMTDEVEHLAIPAIYNLTSELRCEVVPGKMNRHDFELHSR